MEKEKMLDYLSGLPNKLKEFDADEQKKLNDIYDSLKEILDHAVILKNIDLSKVNIEEEYKNGFEYLKESDGLSIK